MRLTEMFEADNGYQSEEEDNSKVKLSDVRKTRLTLRQLNKLRKLHDARSLEQEQKLDAIKLQYGTPAEESGGGMF